MSLFYLGQWNQVAFELVSFIFVAGVDHSGCHGCLAGVVEKNATDRNRPSNENQDCRDVTAMGLSAEIISEFNREFKRARVSGEPEPTAMVLATSDGAGLVTSRTVLLKALDENGFVFFTNMRSIKGKQIADCPRAAATFLWKASGVQVQLIGSVRQGK